MISGTKAIGVRCRQCSQTTQHQAWRGGTVPASDLVKHASWPQRSPDLRRMKSHDGWWYLGFGDPYISPLAASRRTFQRRSPVLAEEPARANLPCLPPTIYTGRIHRGAAYAAGRGYTSIAYSVAGARAGESAHRTADRQRSVWESNRPAQETGSSPTFAPKGGICYNARKICCVS